jgi:hypothetical protein
MKLCLIKSTTFILDCQHHLIIIHLLVLGTKYADDTGTDKISLVCFNFVRFVQKAKI